MEYRNDTVDRDFFFSSEYDWGYEKSDTRKNIMSKMLMHGVNTGIRADIPNGRVISLRRNAASPQQTSYPRVGADYVAPKISEVYSK